MATASLTWLDLTAADRDKVRRMLDLFNEQGTVDELGLGSLRDVLSNALFSGTSVLHTRLRYALFIPWIYREIESWGAGFDVAHEARRLEMTLIDALAESDDPHGVIGIAARESLSRTASNSYWAMLTHWGIFVPGRSQGWYHTHFDSLLRHRHDLPHADDPEDRIRGGSDLHAKLIAVERPKRVTWYFGSANVTAAAYTGRNVEVLASIVGPREAGGKSAGFTLADFREAGFANLCEPYRRDERQPEDPAIAVAKDRLGKARDALVRGNFRISCQPAEEQWRWTVAGEAEIPAGVSIRVWPVSLKKDQFQFFEPSLTWSLPMSRLTAFAAFRLRVDAEVEVEVDDVAFVLKLPVTGMPDGRVAQVLRSLIDSPEKFIRFLRALLGGLDGMVEWAGNGDGAGWQGDWGPGLDGETLLEDLVRAAARDPERLDPVRRLIGDLRSTPERREIVPDELFEIWRVVDEAVSGSD
ncbi:MAG: DUF6361 family protein [Wenzhouxiangellaceae bacterium]|nr:DUF6361 family protein [Wenzhouxiangellaceae bacterium]